MPTVLSRNWLGSIPPAVERYNLEKPRSSKQRIRDTVKHAAIQLYRVTLKKAYSF